MRKGHRVPEDGVPLSHVGMLGADHCAAPKFTTLLLCVPENE
jgi:hypothetical protein